LSIPEHHPSILEARRRGLIVDHARPPAPAAVCEEQPQRPPKARDLVPPAFDPSGPAWTVALYLPSPSNARGVDAGRAGRQRRAVSTALGPHLGVLARFAAHYHAGGALRVRIVRLGPRLLDDDNATAAAKWVRDAVAMMLGADDGPGGRIEWKADQERGPLWGVRVELRLIESLERP
jgi:hypothetical protein